MRPKVITYCIHFVFLTKQVVEKGFKHADNEIRKASYKAWIVLMDNFAEDPSILCSSKRIRLITRPLVVS